MAKTHIAQNPISKCSLVGYNEKKYQVRYFAGISSMSDIPVSAPNDHTDNPHISAHGSSLADLRYVCWIMVASWTLLVIALLQLFTRYLDRSYADLFYAQTSAACDRDLLFHSWAKEIGGFYAFLDPNPCFKNDAKPDITTVKNESLTYVDPDWMIRQVNAMQEEKDRQVVAKLISSHLKNLNNVHDDWDTQALDLFESKKETEVFDIFSEDVGHESARLAQPLIVEEECLECHGEQGYQVGDVYGMISMQVNIEGLYAAKRQIQRISYGAGLGIWLVGTLVIFFFKRRLQSAFEMNRQDWNKLKENETLLQQANQAAEAAKLEAIEASKTKSQFLATMSHEIRTPLNGVIGISELLLETPLESKQLEYVQLVKDSGESLMFLINDILDISRIEAEKLELEQSEFILHDTVESALRIFSAKADEKGLDLVATLDSRIPGPVVGDSGRFHQILVNLIGNAMKFTSQGGVRIHASLDAILDEGVQIKFSVTDTGIGIPKDRQDRLFRDFSQVDLSTTRVYGGTGLGLAITKKLVELMKGSIHVESEEGKSTTFWFTAQFDCSPLVLRCMRTKVHPCIVEKRDYCRGTPPSRCARSGREVSYLQRVAELHGLNILLVGSSEMMMLALVDQMQSWGMSVQTADTPEEAFRYVKEAATPFRLAVVDFKRDDSHSEELIRQIQEKESLQNTALICLTPLSENLQQKNWKIPEKIRYVTKPLCGSVLLDTIVRSFYELPENPYDAAAEKLTIVDQNTRILVAEDNMISRIVISETLKKVGVTFDIVENGLLAVEKVKTESFDVILMDCQMPIMDGYTATQQIRQWEKETSRPSRYPIIALTAGATLEDIQKCYKVSMDAYCSKPINSAKLFKEINRLLNARIV